jgi:hypothetical protein
LFKKRITDDPLCPICGLEVEMVGHILWSCAAARDVWSECKACIQKCCSEEVDFRIVLMKLMDKLEVKDFELVVVIARQIWLRRNKLVFEGEFTPLKRVFTIASDQLGFRRQVTDGKKHETHGSRQQDVVSWKPPARGMVKLNWDAAVDK